MPFPPDIIGTETIQTVDIRFRRLIGTARLYIASKSWAPLTGPATPTLSLIPHLLSERVPLRRKGRGQVEKFHQKSDRYDPRSGT